MFVQEVRTLALLILLLAGTLESAVRRSRLPTTLVTPVADRERLPIPGLSPALLQTSPVPQPTAAGARAECTHNVAPSGSDSNNGSLGAPWRTLQRAFSSVRAGQTVCLMSGTYPIPSTLQRGGYSQILNNSGTSSSWITI